MKLDKNFVILDVGSGTGVIGRALKDKGYGNVHALDVSRNFLDAVRAKDLYSEYFEVFLGLIDDLG